MKTTIALYLFIIHFSFAGIKNISSIQEHDLFSPHKILIESINSSESLIYATRTLEKKPKIVFSHTLFQKLQLKEIEETLLFCHELGHFKAGAPFKKRGRTNLDSWSSSEGQSDFFSTVHCIKEFDLSTKTFIEVKNIETRNEIQEICLQSNHPDCYKVINSIFSIVQVYQSWTHEQNQLHFLNINLSPTHYTILTYPSNQCRLTTLINGFLCEDFDMMTHECLDENYRRPRCWFNE